MGKIEESKDGQEEQEKMGREGCLPWLLTCKVVIKH